MSLRQRIAVTLGAPLIADTVARLRWAEEAGFDDAWFSDGGAPDALTTAAATAHATRHLRIGIAVTPVFTRTPAVLAATAQALSQILPGRFIMGLGSSSETMMAGWNGVPFEKPVTRVRETVVMVRAMLAGEKSDFHLKTLRSHGYSQPRAAAPVPIYVGALQAKMIETAAEVGDGAIFNLWPRQALPKMIAHVRAGAARAGKDWRTVEIVNRHHVLVTDDKARARDLFRKAFAPYYATSVYNGFLAWAGYDAAAATIREGWAAKDRAKTAAALTDTLVDEIAVIGKAEECRERVRWAGETGVHTHIIAPLAGATPAEVEATFAAFAPHAMKS